MSITQIPPTPDRETGKRDGACYTLGFVRAAGGEVLTEDPIKKHAEVVDVRGNHKILKGGGQCWIENKSGVRVAGPWKETGLFIAHGYLKRLEGEAGPTTGKQEGSPFKKPSKEKGEPDAEPERHRTLTPSEKEKAGDIRGALEREHPGMPGEMVGRIAARQGKKGRQEQGPPYTAPLAKPKKEVEEPVTELGCTPPKKHRDKGDSEKDGEGEHEDLAKKRLEELTEE